MTTTTRTLAEQMHDQDFDSCWTVQDGTVVDVPNVSAPPVYTFEQEDGSWSEAEVESSRWELVSAGFTGQHGYSGPCMHSSETFGEGMAQAIADMTDRYSAFATVAVDGLPLDEDEEVTAESWAVVGLIRTATEGN